MGNHTIRLLVINDQASTTERPARLFGVAGDVEVMGETVRDGAALEGLRDANVDVLLLDVPACGANEEKLIAELGARYPGLPVFVLTGCCDAEIAGRMLEAGVAGYLTTNSGLDVLLSALRTVAAGGRFIDPAVADVLSFEPAVAGDPAHRHRVSESQSLVREVQALPRRESCVPEEFPAGQELVRLSEALPGALFTFSCRGGIRAMPYASEKFVDVAGCLPGDVAGDASPFLDMLHREDLGSFLASAEDSARGMSLWHVEFRLRHPRKGEVWIEWLAAPSQQDGGALWHGFLHDIGQRKRLEEERRRRSDFQESLLRALSDVGIQQMVIEEGRLVHVGNRPLAYEFGFTDELIDSHPPLESILHPHDRERVLEYHRRRVLGEPVPNTYELSLVTSIGERREFEAAIAVVPDTQPMRVVSVAKEISRRKRAERELLLLKRAVDQCADALLVHDERLRFVSVNDAASRILGYSRDELLGMGPADIMPDFSSQQREQSFLAAVPGASYTFETHCRAKDGRMFAVELTGTVLQENDARYSISLARDISERKTAELELKGRELEFRTLAENLPDNIARWDVQGRYLYVNPTHERVLGASLEEVLGQAIPDSHTEIKAAIARVAETGEAEYAVRQAVPVNGVEELHEVSLVPEFDAAGRIVSVLGIGRDMTELYRMQDALAAREQQFRSLADGAPDNIIRYDLNGRILYLNVHLIQELGQDPSELIGKTPSEAWPDGRYAAIEQGTLWVIRSGEPTNVELCLPGDGSGPRYAQVLIAPERDVSGHVIGALAFGRDITDVRVPEQRLSRLIASMPGFAFSLRSLPDGRFSFPFTSPGIVDLCGLQPEDVVDDMAPLHALTYPDDRPIVEDALAEAVWTAGPFQVEFRILRHGVGERWIECRSMPDPESTDGMLWHGIMLDITERKLAERELWLKDFIVEHAQQAIFLSGSDLRFIYVNDEACDALGYTRKELLGLRPADIDPDASEGRTTRLQQQISLHGSMLFETRHRRRDGSTFSVEVQGNRVESGGETLSVWFVRDISDRKRREVQESARAEVFDRLSAGDDLSAVLARVVEFAESSRPDLVGAILLPDDSGTVAGHCIAPSMPEAFQRLVQGPFVDRECACGAAAFRKEPVSVDDLAADACSADCKAVAKEFGLATCWAQPIVDGSEALLGIFAFFRRRAGPPDAEDISTMEQARRMARLVIERRREEDRIRWLADYDELTGLYNRSALHARLAEMEQTERFALLFVDIDNFKEINDTLGHHSGDRMLEDVARRLRGVLPAGALAARMGGDEFIVVLPGRYEIGRIERSAERLRLAVAGDYALGHSTVWATASVGVALYPEQTRDVHELLSYADQALYVAKSEGRNCVRVFNQIMLKKTRAHVRLASDLRGALAAGQLSLQYQPIFDIASGRVHKAEALLRWQHPELGPVSPEEFIPVAEETGIIREIGDWVFREVARVSSEWNCRVADDGTVRIGVNCSPRQFFSGEGVSGWCDFLDAEGIHGQYLDIEITEGLLLDDRPEVLSQLQQLRAAGMTMSVDDFGTGYSALSYLKKFEIDYLKIDRSFIRDIVDDPSDRAIVESIIVMASRLGIKLVAEGVETAEQAELLGAAGCDMAQGYYFARPMSEASFLAFVGATA